MHKKPMLKRMAIAVAVVAALVLVRVLLAPKAGDRTLTKIAPAERPQVQAALAASAVPRPQLLAELAAKRVLLVGEEHFQQEPQLWLQALLDDLHATDSRAAVLLLELPAHTQPDIDRYLASGDESALQRAFSGSDVLPYSSTVRWARAHRQAVSAVGVDDENSWHIGLMRLLLTDTRNETMARAIAAAAHAHPGDRIIAYGGRLHMTNAGRYMYDSETRRPVGARLPAFGIPRKDIAAIWLFAGQDPIDGIWEKTGTVTFAAPLGDLAIAKLEDQRIYGATRLKEIADYAVHLGPVTPIQH